MENSEENLQPRSSLIGQDTALAVSGILSLLLLFIGIPLLIFFIIQTNNAQNVDKTNPSNKVLGAEYGEQYVRNLTPYPNDQDDAEISGNKIAWLSHDNGNTTKPELYVTDLTTNTQVKITTDGVNPNASTAFGIDGSKVVYQNFDSGFNGPINVYVYDLTSSTNTKITNDSCHSVYPAISGNKVVYASDKNNGCSFVYDIYVYDLSTNTETRITTDTNNQYFPEISGNKVVYLDNRHGNFEIYLYDLGNSTEIRITNNSSSSTDPTIYGNKIVWQGQGSNYDIFLYDISTASTTQITNNSASQLGPNISGNKIVWTDYRNGGTNADIYQYDLSTNQETQITFNTTFQYRPSISGDRITWVDERNGNSNKDIYIYDPPQVSPPSPPPPSPPPSPPGPTPPPFKKVEICHRKGDGGFEVITVSEQATLNGHLAHSGDIIPATEGCKPRTIKEVVLPDTFRRENSATTDLSKISNPAKVEKFTLDTLANTIIFKDSLDLSSQEVLNKLNFLNLYLSADKLGIISLDSTTLPFMNKKATLSMKKLPFIKKPRVLVNGKEDKKVVSNVKYSNWILSFDVSHFSTFAAGPVIELDTPVNNFKTTNNSLTIKGIVSDPTAQLSLKVNNKDLGKLDISVENGGFKRKINLMNGVNTLVLTALSSNGSSYAANISGVLYTPKNPYQNYIIILVGLILISSLGITYLIIKKKHLLASKKDQDKQ